jgi:hypothetical protein
MNADLLKLRQHLKAGGQVRHIEVRSGSVVVVFNDCEMMVPSFKIGTRCREFAEFVIEAGLDNSGLEGLGKSLVDAIEDYIFSLPKDLEGPIEWIDSEGTGF